MVSAYAVRAFPAWAVDALEGCCLPDLCCGAMNRTKLDIRTIIYDSLDIYNNSIDALPNHGTRLPNTGTWIEGAGERYCITIRCL